MKTGPALWCALSLWFGTFTCPAIEGAMTPAASAHASTVDDQFFLDHPDLKDEAEVVDEASKELASGGFQDPNPKTAADALAAKSHAILAARTPEEWQQKAVSLYPALGESGSEFNKLFVEHYRELKASSPAFTAEPSWPVLLAKRCDDELRAGPPPAVPVQNATPSQSQAAAPQDSKSPAVPVHRAKNFWQTSIGLLLLVILTAIPGAFAFRKAQMHKAAPPEKTSPSEPKPAKASAARTETPIWRTALKHAAIIYVVVALPTSVHSLMANADLGFIDRLFVSLVVGSLFGLFIALPLYGMDALWHACQKHPIRPSIH